MNWSWSHSIGSALQSAWSPSAPWRAFWVAWPRKCQLRRTCGRLRGTSICAVSQICWRPRVVSFKSTIASPGRRGSSLWMRLSWCVPILSELRPHPYSHCQYQFAFCSAVFPCRRTSQGPWVILCRCMGQSSPLVVRSYLRLDQHCISQSCFCSSLRELLGIINPRSSCPVCRKCFCNCRTIKLHWEHN